MAAPYTLAGCLHGARLCLPLTPGLLVFGAAFGTAAAQKGLSLWEAVGLSAFVFAGAAQMVGLELWRETARETLAAPDAAAVIEKAERIAESLKLALYFRVAPEGPRAAA